jgi:hypothetical protein
VTARRHRTSRRELRVLLRAAGCRPISSSSTRLEVIAHRPDAAVAERHLPSRRELRSLLRAAGSRPVPPLAPAFVVERDTRLRSRVLVLEPRATRRDRRARRPAVVSGAAAAAAALVVVGALTGVAAGPGADAELVLGTAVDTVVSFPDGSTVDGSRGLVLPDGAVVRTGPNGRAAAGGVELGPGLEAVVDSGELLASSTAQASPAEPVTPGQGEATAAAVVEHTPEPTTPKATTLTAPVEVPAPADAARRLDLPRESISVPSTAADRLPGVTPGR